VLLLVWYSYGGMIKNESKKWVFVERKRERERKSRERE